MSDHFHPWTDRQGQSPFVWSVIGAIAATTRLTVGTGVTCPIIRTHPAIVAQAAATSAVMLDGRFFLGVGTGENLNEHVVGRGWPPLATRRDMLEEAIEVLRHKEMRRRRLRSRRSSPGRPGPGRFPRLLGEGAAACARAPKERSPKLNR